MSRNVMATELYMYADELDFLKELINFLRHFKQFSDLFGVSQPN